MFTIFLVVNSRVQNSLDDSVVEDIFILEKNKKLDSWPERLQIFHVSMSDKDVTTMHPQARMKG